MTHHEKTVHHSSDDPQLNQGLPWFIGNFGAHTHVCVYIYAYMELYSFQKLLIFNNCVTILNGLPFLLYTDCTLYTITSSYVIYIYVVYLAILYKSLITDDCGPALRTFGFQLVQGEGPAAMAATRRWTLGSTVWETQCHIYIYICMYVYDVYIYIYV